MFMEGTIVNYRRNGTGQTPNHLVVTVESVDTRDKAEKMVGKKVTYHTGKKDMVGKINAAHGNKGALRAVFETGLPGQCLGKKVKIE
jgi:large subunit ribosomal protein L35Ae